jgi:hypothetical protein
MIFDGAPGIIGSLGATSLDIWKKIGLCLQERTAKKTNIIKRNDGNFFIIANIRSVLLFICMLS